MFRKSLAAPDWKGLAFRAWPAVLFVGLYVAGAELGHQLSFCEHFATFWPPCGIFLAALLISEVRRWPAVIFLALFANLITDFVWSGRGISVSLGYWSITTAEAVTGAWLLRRFVAGDFTGESLREMLGLSFLGAFLPTMIGGLMAETLLTNPFPGSREALTWELWCNSHMLGVIVFAPIILTLAAKKSQWSAFRISGRVVLEALVAFVSLTGFARLVYSSEIQPYAFLVFPVLVWIALRFEIWGTCAGNLIRVYICIHSTRLGFGPFAGDYPATDQAVILSGFLSITCATTLLLAAIIAERRRASRALQYSEQRYRDLLENIGDLVHSVNAEGTILYTNRAWRETLGYDLGETNSLSMFQIVHPDDLPRYRLKLERVLSGQASDRYEFRFLTKDGRTLVVEGTCNCRIVDGHPNTTRSIYRDITSRREHEAQLDTYRRQLEAANSQLHQLATTDGLTGLHNRRAFHTRLAEEVERAERHSHEVSLLMVDVDHFKQINDVFGHPTGDKVLKRVAKVLNDNAREYDFVSRFGGEEFTVILPKTDEAEAMVIADRLRIRIASIPFPGRQITVSVGVATLARQFASTDLIPEEASLVKSADIALYHSKQHGRNRVTHASNVPSIADVLQSEDTDSGAFRLEFANW